MLETIPATPDMAGSRDLGLCSFVLGAFDKLPANQKMGSLCIACARTLELVHWSSYGANCRLPLLTVSQPIEPMDTAYS